jgi:hypothetical protein
MKRTQGLHPHPEPGKLRGGTTTKLTMAGNRKFESISLQRRVTSEPIGIALNSGTDAFISK